VNRHFRVNRSFPTFLPRHPSWILAQKTAAGRQGLPPQVRSDSIEARKDSHPREKIKRLLAPGVLSGGSRPERGGLLGPAPVGVNRPRTFPDAFRTAICPGLATPPLMAGRWRARLPP